jgi:hypothetical protein
MGRFPPPPAVAGRTLGPSRYLGAGALPSKVHHDPLGRRRFPEDRREEGDRRSIARGGEFFLRHRLVEEGKGRYAPWFRIHYPDHSYYDVLVGLRILTRLGYGDDRRLAPALNWLRRKRLPGGEWALDAVVPDLEPALARVLYENETVYPMMLEPLHGPSQWATVEALSVLTLTTSNEN